MLKAKIKKLDEVDEQFRGLYKGDDENGYVLQVEAVEGFALEDVSGLKHVLTAERAKAAKASTALKKFGSNWDDTKKDWVHTLDPDEAKAAIAYKTEFEGLDPTKEADKIATAKLESAKRQMQERFDTEMRTKDERIGKLVSTVDGLSRKQQAIAAIAEHKGSVDLLLPHVLSSTKVKETDDGKIVVQVIDADGNERIGNAKGEPMSVSDLVAELKKSEVFGRAFESSGMSGSGARPSDAGGHGGGKKEKGDFGGSKQERTQAIASKFPELAQNG